ncbi:uncharacterized protein LOC131673346 [Phymastichus coffea]|uniref:uncharacterized protein LOC131673346 n=1 Tax=Phymastichus coffea TaxID=108790 RepID=UPI00273B01A5|nr:uncharacterized protein LOC131673346 [Phymastichus coffea]
MFSRADRKRALMKSLNDRAFLIAVIDEDYEKVDSLIRENININFQDEDGCTSLHILVENGNANIFKLLIENGASLSIKNSDGETPLDFAKRLNKSEILRIIEVHSSHPSPAQDVEPVSDRSQGDEATPLDVAETTNQTEVIRVAEDDNRHPSLAQDVELESDRVQDDETTLMEVAEISNQAEVIRVTEDDNRHPSLAQDVEPESDRLQDDETTLLEVAETSNQAEVIRVAEDDNRHPSLAQDVEPESDRVQGDETTLMEVAETSNQAEVIKVAEDDNRHPSLAQDVEPESDRVQGDETTLMEVAETSNQAEVIKVAEDDNRHPSLAQDVEPESDRVQGDETTLMEVAETSNQAEVIKVAEDDNRHPSLAQDVESESDRVQGDETTLMEVAETSNQAEVIRVAEDDKSHPIIRVAKHVMPESSRVPGEETSLSKVTETSYKSEIISIPKDEHRHKIIRVTRDDKSWPPPVVKSVPDQSHIDKISSLGLSKVLDLIENVRIVEDDKGKSLKVPIFKPVSEKVRVVKTTVMKVPEPSYQMEIVRLPEDDHKYPIIRVARDDHKHPTIRVAKDDNRQPSPTQDVMPESDRLDVDEASPLEVVKILELMERLRTANDDKSQSLPAPVVEAVSDSTHVEKTTSRDVAKTSRQMDVIWEAEDDSYDPLPAAGNAPAGIQITPQSLYKTYRNEGKYGTWIDPVYSDIYRLKVLLLLLKRAISCKCVIRIGITSIPARIIDNLTLRFTIKNKYYFRIVHIKYKINDSKKITANNLLLETDGDYSLIKYFKSYQTFKKARYSQNAESGELAICTNSDFDYDNLKEAAIEVERILAIDEFLYMYSDEKEPKKYRFKSEKLIPKLKDRLQSCGLEPKFEISDHEVDDFLQHIVFLVNQPNEEEINDFVKFEVKVDFDFTTVYAYNKVMLQMLNWLRLKHQFFTFMDCLDLLEALRKAVPLWYNVQDPVEPFTGRRDFLIKLHELMEAENNAMVCVSGHAGVGKSEVVKKYINEFAPFYNYSINWINAESYETIAESFRELACHKLWLKPINAPDHDLDVSKLVCDVFNYFAKYNSLFVFDNAQMYESEDNKIDAGIDRFLKCSCTANKHSHRPRIIITSRKRKWPKHINVLLLKPFTDDEATLFIADSLQLSDERQFDHVLKLGKQLKMLPLALRQAIAYIKMQNEDLIRRGRCPNFKINDYLAKLPQVDGTCTAEFSNEDGKSFCLTVFKTMKLALSAIEELVDGDLSMKLLYMAAYFRSYRIPMEILVISENSKATLPKALETLRKYALINVYYKSVTISSLVQQITRSLLNTHDGEKKILDLIWCGRAGKPLNIHNVDHIVSAWPYCKKYLDVIEEHPFIPRLLADILMRHYRANEGLVWLYECIDSLSRLSETRPLNWNLILCYRILGFYNMKHARYELAARDFEMLYNLEKTHNGENHLDTVNAMLSAAAVYTKLGWTDKALNFYKQILRTQRAMFGRDHVDTLVTKRQIANVLITQKKFEEVLPLLEQLYDVYTKRFGAIELNTMEIRLLLVGLYGKMNRYDKALVLLKQSNEAKQEWLGEHHASIWVDRLLWAQGLLEYNKDKEAAAEAYEKLLVSKVTVLGELHEEVVEFYAKVAQFLLQMDMIERCIPYFREAIRRRKDFFGSFDRELLLLEDQLAKLLHDREELDEALALYHDILLFKDEIKDDEKEPFDYVYITRQIVDIHVVREQSSPAIHHSLNLLKVYEKTLGKNHETTVDTRKSLGIMIYHMGDFNRAFGILTDIDEISKKIYGADDPRYDNLLKVIDFMVKYRDTGKEIPLTAAYAIKVDDMKALKQLLAEGVDLNTQDEAGRTLLHIAAGYDNLEIVKYLAERGADATIPDREGRTVLHTVTLKNNMAMAETLFDNVTVDMVDKLLNAKDLECGDTALHLAAKTGLNAMARALMYRGAVYDIKNHLGETPSDVVKDKAINRTMRKAVLFHALAKEKNLLYDATDDETMSFISSRNNDGYNLCQLALMNNNVELTSQLLDFMVRVPRYQKSSAETLAALQVIPLALAVKSELGKSKGYKNTRALLAAFRERDKRVSDKKIVALEDTFKVLDMDPPIPDIENLGRTAVSKHTMAFISRLASVQLLISTKANDFIRARQCLAMDADVDEEDDGGWTALHHAANNKNDHIVRLLLCFSANIYCQTKTGNTPLHMAANRGNPLVVELLLEKDRANRVLVNTKTVAKGSSPLHIAAKNGYTGIVATLLRYGACYCHLNKDGKTPLELTNDAGCRELLIAVDSYFAQAKAGTMELVRKLRKFEPAQLSVAISARDNDNRTIADVIMYNRHVELTVEFSRLVEHTLGKIKP